VQIHKETKGIMISKESIDVALKSHSLWKRQLKEAITTGQSEFKIWIVMKGDECEFGKWLARLSPEEMQSEDVQKVKILHTEFHEAAGKVLEFALTGGSDAALKMMSHRGIYRDVSRKLVSALNNWKKNL
jgi:Chemoreceptor zinc-binding domain